MASKSRRKSSRLLQQTKNTCSDSDDGYSDDDIQHLATDIGERLREILSTSNTNVDGNESEDDVEDGHDEEDEDCEDTSLRSPVEFVIDKSGGETSSGSMERMYKQHNTQSDDQDQLESDESESDQSDDEETSDDGESNNWERKKNSMVLSSSLQPAMDADKLIYLNTDIYGKPKLRNTCITELMLNPQGKNSELLKKSVLTTDLEKKTEIKPYNESLNQLKKQRRLECQKTKGQGWFHMRAPEMTEEKKNDLMVLQMRRSLDPKQFYKAPDRKALPKYFQMGKVIEAPADFYNSRVPKKQRKQTLVDELLADAEFRRYNKRKYSEIQEAKMKRGRGGFKRQKRMKKRKK